MRRFCQQEMIQKGRPADGCLLASLHIGCYCCAVASAGFVMTVRIIFSVAIPGRKLLGREGDAAEHFAGIFCAAAALVAAFLAGKSVIQHRHDELGLPLQPDDGELPQSHKQLPLAACDHQRLVKEIPDTFGDLNRNGAFTPTGVALPDLGGQNHRVENFHC